MKHPRAGTVLELRATRLAPAGWALAFVDGLEVRIWGLLPAEPAKVRIEHVSKGAPVAFARVLKVLKPDAARRQPPCEHHGRCTGCALMFASTEAQAQIKRERVGRALSLPPPELIAIPGAELGYRWSSKRVVSGRAGALCLGSYRLGSHDVAAMDGCLVDHPDIAAAAREVREQANLLGIEPYRAPGSPEAPEGTAPSEGDLRYVWFKTNGSGEVLVTLVSSQPTPLVDELAKQLPRAAGVAACVQSSSGNAIRGTDVKHLGGRRTIAFELCGQRLEQGPLGFLQPNPKVAELAYRRLLEGMSGARALDLYAGAGITTALLRERFEQVTPCETYPEAAAALGIEPLAVDAFLEQCLEAGEGGPDLVVANPPRAGMGAEVCTLLRRLAPRRLHVMSCNPESMARDLTLLTAADQFVVDDVIAYDTLPHTAHVELVVRLSHRD